MSVGPRWRCERCDAEAIAPVFSYREGRCSNCGGMLVHSAPSEATTGRCPVCEVTFEERTLGEVTVAWCAVCHGMLIPLAVLERWTADQGHDAPAGFDDAEVFAMTWDVRYRRCPLCREVMNRVNFAGNTGVIVDVCLADGWWLDAGELTRVLDHARTRGLEGTLLDRVAMERRERTRAGTLRWYEAASDPTSALARRRWTRDPRGRWDGAAAFVRWLLGW